MMAGAAECCSEAAGTASQHLLAEEQALTPHCRALNLS